MLTQPCTRRCFVASTSLIIASVVIPASRLRWSDERALTMFVSAERASHFNLATHAVLFDGPRIARMEAMVDSLPKFVGEILLRLDATDDHLLDVAAQQAGVSVKRGAVLPHGLGIRAHVIPQQRNFA